MAASGPAEEAMMPSTETRPVETDPDTSEGDGYAHYADKTEITRAAIEGGTVTALCGFKFPPVRDPQRFPVCPRCKELAALLWGPE
jgi:hypothetical protein